MNSFAEAHKEFAKSMNSFAEAHKEVGNQIKGGADNIARALDNIAGALVVSSVVLVVSSVVVGASSVFGRRLHRPTTLSPWLTRTLRKRSWCQIGRR